jgi:hypothetical protein
MGIAEDFGDLRNMTIVRDRTRNRKFPWIVFDNTEQEYHCERCGRFKRSRGVSETRKATERDKFIKKHRSCLPKS